jgi:hypothetical protein
LAIAHEIARYGEHLARTVAGHQPRTVQARKWDAEPSTVS